MFPWIDLFELIKRIIARIRTGRPLGKTSGFNTKGELVDRDLYEVETTKIIRRGVLCFKATILQTWAIVTITAQPGGKVILGPLPYLEKESIVREQQVDCPPDDAEISDVRLTTAQALFADARSRADAGF